MKRVTAIAIASICFIGSCYVGQSAASLKDDRQMSLCIAAAEVRDAGIDREQAAEALSHMHADGEQREVFWQCYNGGAK